MLGINEYSYNNNNNSSYLTLRIDDLKKYILFDLYYFQLYDLLELDIF